MNPTDLVTIVLLHLSSCIIKNQIVQDWFHTHLNTDFVKSYLRGIQEGRRVGGGCIQITARRMTKF